MLSTQLSIQFHSFQTNSGNNVPPSTPPPHPAPHTHTHTFWLGGSLRPNFQKGAGQDLNF